MQQEGKELNLGNQVSKLYKISEQNALESYQTDKEPWQEYTSYTALIPLLTSFTGLCS